jgi:hypothetical protein
MPQRVQDIFASMRSNLLCIIQNWERSGQQGEGGTDETSDAEQHHEDADVHDIHIVEESGGDTVMGGLQGRPARALDRTRAAFLYDKPSYLLYFCEIADRHYNDYMRALVRRMLPQLQVLSMSLVLLSLVLLAAVVVVKTMK